MKKKVDKRIQALTAQKHGKGCCVKGFVEQSDGSYVCEGGEHSLPPDS